MKVSISQQNFFNNEFLQPALPKQTKQTPAPFISKLKEQVELLYASNDALSTQQQLSVVLYQNAFQIDLKHSQDLRKTHQLNSTHLLADLNYQLANEDHFVHDK